MQDGNARSNQSLVSSSQSSATGSFYGEAECLGRMELDQYGLEPKTNACLVNATFKKG